jgi:mannose-1-phosphate guanylyltransferase
MLEHTLDRARRLVGRQRILTIIDRSHRRFLRVDGQYEIPGRVLEQPRQLDTGPGILLPATYVLARDPTATVVILPSDHYVYPEERFLARVQQAVSLVERRTDRLILLGAKPNRAEADYGWIRARTRPGSRFSQSEATEIQAFLEKPSERATRQILLMPMTDVEWSDWGRPARIAESLASLGKNPLIPVESEDTPSEAVLAEERLVG